MILRAENISKRYFRKTGEANYFYAVKQVSLTLEPGTVTVLEGRSGSGKTTLLHMLAGLLSPSEGKVFADETDLYSLKDQELSVLRNRKTGVVPQARSAIQTLSVRENILLPCSLYGQENPDRRKNASKDPGGVDQTKRCPEQAGIPRSPQEACVYWMEELGISALADSRPAELSGGELRRMAIARALTADPEVLLADEPTGDLDDENTIRVLETFQKAARSGKAVLLVSHDSQTLSYADRSFRMDQGELQSE